MMLGGITPMTYDSRVTRNCGASGQGASVVAAPPVFPRASSTRVRAPDLARYAAATSPLWPPPTTIASYRPAMGSDLLPSGASAGNGASGAAPQRLTECSV